MNRFVAEFTKEHRGGEEGRKEREGNG